MQSRGGSHMTRATSPRRSCRSEDWGLLDRDVFQLRPDSVSVPSQDVPYPVEAVVQVGGYVVHQVTPTDHLKTGDQVQLHLDEVRMDTVPGRPDGSCLEGGR